MSEERGENLLLPFLFNTEDASAKALLKGQLLFESKLAASPRSLIDQPSTKVVTRSAS